MTIWVTSPARTPGRLILARSRLAVSENRDGHLEHWSAAGGVARVPVPAGTRTSLLVWLAGPQPLSWSLTVTAPPPLRIVGSRGGVGLWLVSMSSPLRRPPPPMLCGTDRPVGAGPGGAGPLARPDPVLGRPPYGAFDPAVEGAAARAGLTALAGWSATVSGNRIQTWDGRPLRPGEIVILHWVPGLGRQLVTLLAAIRALHLHPARLTPASFSGIAPQTRSLSGD